MPQNGFHGLAGMAIAKLAARRLNSDRAEPAVAGIVLGAIAPDVDMYPTAVVFLMGRHDLIYVVHRSLTHSILMVLLLLAASWIVRKPSLRWLFLGLAVGVASHLLLDMMFWFTQIDLFWPLSHFPGSNLDVVDIWNGFRLPSLLVNIREAMEFLAYGLLLRALRSISGDSSLILAERAAWVLLSLTLGTAFLLRDYSAWQNVLVSTPYLLFFLPFCWLKVWQNRRALAAWVLGSNRASRRDEAASHGG